MTRREDGFTLVELLVAMTVLALLMVLLFGGLRFGTRAWESGDRSGAATGEVRSVQALLRGVLEQACPRRMSGGAAGAPPIVDFTGGPQAMDFLGRAPASLGGASCARIALAARTEHARTQLVFLMRGANGQVVQRVLADRASGAAFAYFADGIWQDNWSRRTDLPSLIRLRLRFPQGDARAWPELFIAPRVSAEADCAYDPATKGCQGS